MKMPKITIELESGLKLSLYDYDFKVLFEWPDMRTAVNLEELQGAIEVLRIARDTLKSASSS